MPQNQQAIEQTKRDRRDDEQIHRRDTVGMIMKKRLPPLRWRASSPGHILGHTRLSDIDPELEQLSMDPRRSPERVPKAHSSDQVSNLPIDPRSATERTGLPSPVSGEPHSVPAHDRLGPDNGYGVQDAR